MSVSRPGENMMLFNSLWQNSSRKSSFTNYSPIWTNRFKHDHTIIKQSSQLIFFRDNQKHHLRLIFITVTSFTLTILNASYQWKSISRTLCKFPSISFHLITQVPCISFHSSWHVRLILRRTDKCKTQTR